MSKSNDSLENTRESLKTKLRTKTGSVGKVLGKFIQKSFKTARRRSLPGNTGGSLFLIVPIRYALGCSILILSQFPLQVPIL